MKVFSYRPWQLWIHKRMTRLPYYPLQRSPLYWIDNEQALIWATKRLSTEKAIGVDTETNSLYAYQDEVCLIQIASWDEDYIIDPLAFKDKKSLQALSEIMADAKIVKIFHGADYDISGMRRDFGVKFANIFDTYMAARYLKFEKLGLQYLVDHYFGIYLDKTLTKFNWAIRPLPDAELSYAREDVRYIIPLMDRLYKELSKRGIADDVIADFSKPALQENQKKEIDPDRFMRIKGASQLTPKQLRTLRELFDLREEKAKQYNSPAFKVMNDYTMIDLARLEIDEKLDFNVRNQKGLPGYRRQEMIQGILAAIRRAQSLPPIEHKIPRRGKKSSSENNFAYFSRKKANEDLREWRNTRANETIDPQAILPNFALDEILTKAPRTTKDLLALTYLGESRVRKYGQEILTILQKNEITR